MTQPIPYEILLPFLKAREGCVLRVYDDKRPKVALSPGDTVQGVLTAGYGHTGDLRIGQAVTQEMADAWLRDDVQHKACALLAAKIGAVVDDLTPHQYAALLSFVFNLGTGDPKKPEWTIWKRLKARQFDQVPLEMAKFVNWNGAKSEGLVARRAAETVLWSTEEPGSLSVTPPSSVTRREATPATPADPKVVSTPMWATAASAIVATPAGIKGVIDQITPYADKSTHVAQAIGSLSTLAAAAAVLAMVVTCMKHRTLRT